MMETDDLSNSIQKMDLSEQNKAMETGDNQENRVPSSSAPTSSAQACAAPPAGAQASSAPPDESDDERQLKAEVSTVLPSGYKLSHCLSEGAMGRVYLVFNTKSKDVLAAKVVNYQRDPGQLRKIREETKREAEIQRKLSHPGVCLMYGCRNTATYAVLFMEFLAGGELFDRIPIGFGMHIKMAFSYFEEILEALHYMHRHGYAHLDVKPENIMLTKRGKAKLIDFGWAVNFKTHGPSFGKTGTVTYAAPEVFELAPYHGPPADLFSLGITFMTVVTGERCWGRAAFTDDAYRAWQKRCYEYAPFDRLPPDMLNFLGRLMAHKPGDRLVYEKIIEHPWFLKAKDNKMISVTSPRGLWGAVTCSQPANASSQSGMMGNAPVLCELPHSQPTDSNNMLAEVPAGTQPGVHITSMMRRMTRFFSNLPLQSTINMLKGIIAQHKLLRLTVKGPANMIVEIRHPENPSTFRILIYNLAGGLLVECRRVSGDELLFRENFQILLHSMRIARAVDEEHPYLSMVLPQKVEDNGEALKETATNGPVNSGEAEAKRIQSMSTY